MLLSGHAKFTPDGHRAMLIVPASTCRPMQSPNTRHATMTNTGVTVVKPNFPLMSILPKNNCLKSLVGRTIQTHDSQYGTSECYVPEVEDHVRRE